MNHDVVESKMKTLKDIEELYAVDTWIFDGIAYWPILKNIIYFNDRRSTISDLFKSPDKILNKFRSKLSKRKSFLYTADNVQEKKDLNYDLLFCGSATYRDFFKGYSLNKYFDPLMDELDYSSALFEYSLPSHNTYKEERVVNALINYVQQKHTHKLPYTTDLFDNLLVVAHRSSINQRKLQRLFFKIIESVISWRKYWEDELKRKNPKAVFILCYYNEPMYGLILAANKLAIPTIDMQHGGQGELHPAYSFTNFPSQSFNTLPNYFWLWDRASYDHVDSWGQDSKLKYFIGGNPWISFLKKEQTQSSGSDTKKIICTLTLRLPQILPEFMVYAIKASPKEYIWFLRLHPRSTDEDKRQLLQIVSRHSLADRVELEQANTTPLPMLLAEAWAHVSHSSGSISEAALMGLQRNVITDKIGLKNYSYLIKDKKAYFYDQSSGYSLWDFLIKLELSDNTVDHFSDFKGLINEIIKKL